MTQTNNRSVSTEKVCIRCGLDCSTRPRTKDQQGRYTCRECFDALQERQASAAAAGVGAAAAAPAAVADGAPGEDGLMAALLSEAVQQQAAPPAVAPCPGCGHPLAATASICTGCGFNRRTGGAVQTRKVTEEAPSRTGPRTERDRAREFEEREAKRIEQMEYLKPVLVAAMGIIGVCVFLNANQNQVGLTVGKYLAAYPLSLAVSALIYAGYCLTKIGFNASPMLSGLRLAAVVAAIDLLRIPLLLFGGMDGFGQGLLVTLLPFGLCIGLLNYFLDLDLLDAIILGVLLTATLFGAGFVINAAMGV